ncbi:hypothetical protein Y032_0479g2225 [Ancylostoma ceylanicum]|uniref:Uncharacterized protein n=1 Tax=Ancylostoma ceylanicum TaxID=53326 RepID=A0A016WVK3_9BILA|nr:hypothetical protein Y032_0479g2225 [Ancylostoma ceylanicum]
MDFSKQYICGILVYGFKFGESATVASSRINTLHGIGPDAFLQVTSTSIFPHDRDSHPGSSMVDCGSW